MSVESSIRTMMTSGSLNEAYPGFGKNKEAKPARQGSSSTEEPEVAGKSAGVDAVTASTTPSLAPGVGAFEGKPAKQGSSQDAPVVELDKDAPGKTAAAKMSKMKTLTNRGAGDAPNFKTFGGNASGLKGEEVEVEGDLVEEEEIEEEEEVIPEEEEDGPEEEEEEVAEELEMDEIIEFLDSIGVELTEEQLDELNKSTLASYVSKAKGSAKKIDKTGEKLIQHAIDRDNTRPGSGDPVDNRTDQRHKTIDKLDAKLSGRFKGIRTAKKKLAAEDFDVATIFESETDLSEEFKTKAASLFEAMVSAKVSEHVASIREALVAESQEVIAEHHAELVEKIDNYLSYVVETWLSENELAVENGLKNEITENFINGLKNLFAENYIEVPAEKFDVLGEMDTRIAGLEEEVNARMAEIVELNSQLVETKKNLIFSSVTEGLAQTEIEKFASLIEDVTFDNAELFEEKLLAIKETYFPKAKVIIQKEEDSLVSSASINESSSVSIYAKAMGRTTF